MKYFAVLAFLSLMTIDATAQTTTAPPTKFNGRGYGEVYYSYDFAQPPNHEKPSFIYNHKRHNELAANLLLVQGSYNDDNCRANIGLMAGNYAQYNLSAEPNWAQNIYEANAGIKLFKEKNIWLDAGILPSHIGFESAISADCATLTRSMLAENSPYYESGLKLSYTSPNEKIYLAALLLNGWQKIQKPNFAQKPSIGLQATYKPNEKITLNYSNFVGNDAPDSVGLVRQYHNIYAIYAPTKKLSATAGADIGIDKIKRNKGKLWHAAVAILKYNATEKTAIALRTEYYFDKNQVIVRTNTPNGFLVSGASINIDYKINAVATVRLEAKNYQSKDVIFSNNSRKNYALTANMTVRL